jgi:hypothetical protein
MRTKHLPQRLAPVIAVVISITALSSAHGTVFTQTADEIVFTQWLAHNGVVAHFAIHDHTKFGRSCLATRAVARGDVLAWLPMRTGFILPDITNWYGKPHCACRGSGGQPAGSTSCCSALQVHAVISPHQTPWRTSAEPSRFDLPLASCRRLTAADQGAVMLKEMMNASSPWSSWFNVLPR